MEKYHVVLREDEKQTLAKIDLNDSHTNHTEGRAAYLANMQPIMSLLKSLDDRSAIPPQRLKYWNDPNYHKGRIKASRKGIFERNGCTGEDIYTHPHFLKYFRYFLFGTELPANVIVAFEEKMGDPRWVSSSDIVPIGKFARDLTRRYALDKSDAPEEFFKLCLDLGLSLSTAESVMRAVKQLR